jgi:hypothetical protein
MTFMSRAPDVPPHRRARFGQCETFDINYWTVANLYAPRFSKHQDCEDVGR